VIAAPEPDRTPGAGELHGERGPPGRGAQHGDRGL
jgi:hypothetical protein